MSWERTGARLRPIGPSSSQPQKPYTEMGSQPTGNTFAIVNQKGGVGKTTTAVNLSAALASLGRIILLVDLDPQGNSTSGVGISKTGLRMSVYDVLIGGDPLDHVIQRTATAGLDLVPSDVRLAGAEVELTATIARENRLKAALRTARNHYDVVIIDCPPSLGLLTINALTAADACLIPVQCEYYALEGLSSLVTTIDLVRRHLNTGLEVSGVLLTMADPRTKLSDQVATEVRNHFGSKVYETVVPRSVRLAEAPSYGQPIIAYAPGSRGAAAYLTLAGEFADRIGLPHGSNRGAAVQVPASASGVDPNGDGGD